MSAKTRKSRLSPLLIGPLFLVALFAGFFEVLAGLGQKKKNKKKKDEEPEVVVCPFGTGHDESEELCDCGFGDHSTIVSIDGYTGPWSGGFYALRQDMALQPCAKVHPEYTEATKQFALTDEEAIIIAQWREFREDVLKAFGRRHAYRYELLVRMGDMVYEIMARTQGIVEPTEPFQHKEKN